MWPPALHLDQRVLFDDIRKLLLLLFPLVHLLFQVRYLLRNAVEPMTIARLVRDGADKGGVWVLKRLRMRIT